MSKQDKIVDKVRKLIAKAESTDSADEANVFMAKANDLLTKHNLSQTDVEVHVSDVETNRESFGEIKHEGDWERILCNVLSEFNLCDIIVHYKAKDGKRLHHGSISIIGTYANVTFVHYAYNVCRDVFRREARSSYNKLKKDAMDLYGDDELTLQKSKQLPYRTVYIRSFLKGCCAGLYRQLEAVKLENEKREYDKHINDDQSIESDYALMVTKHNHAIEKWMEDKYPDLKKGRAVRKPSNQSAVAKGMQVGKSINLNKGVEGSVERTKIG